MHWRTFGRSLIFSAIVALGVVPFLLVVAPMIGKLNALGLYSAMAVALYISGIARTTRRGVRIGLLAAVLAAGVCAIASSLTEVVLGLTVVLAICRSGFLFRCAPARALTIEIVLGCVSLVAACVLFVPGYIGVGFAVWGYFLAHSVYFLVGGIERRVVCPSDQDPFEVAKARALAIIDQP